MILALLLALAQQAPVACPATPVPVTGPLAAWNTRTALDASHDAAMIPLGQAVDAKLTPGTRLIFPVKPEKPYAPDAYGAILAFHIDKPGTITVGLGAAAWVDLAGQGALQPSVGHGHGLACSSLRKFVKFKVVPGDYALQVSGSARETLSVLVTRPE